MELEFTNTDDAPRAIGPYSQAVRAGEWLFTSGQIPLEPSTGKIVSQEIAGQTRQVMKNLEAVLKAEGLEFSNVVETTIYLSDMKNFQTLNTVYAEYMKDHRPARATVQVAGLPLGALVEIKMTAHN